MVNICENILDASKNIFMNLTPYVFDVDHVAKIRSELFITILEKKIDKTTAYKNDLKVRSRLFTYLCCLIHSFSRYSWATWT